MTVGELCRVCHVVLLAAGPAGAPEHKPLVFRADDEVLWGLDLQGARDLAGAAVGGDPGVIARDVGKIEGRVGAALGVKQQEAAQREEQGDDVPNGQFLQLKEKKSY